MTREIPIFFSTDDKYIPYLDIAISSLITNASREYEYRIIVLNTGLDEENVKKIRQHESLLFKIEFIDISDEVERIRSQLRNVYHFSVVTYYRMFIASLFPKYDRVIYLDCDIVVLGDISELYFTELGDNILGAAPEQFVQNTKEFRIYAQRALGVDPDSYVNAGVLVMDLEAYRRHGIEEEFIRLIKEYNFDLLDPDQAYLNYLCYGKIRILPNGWNKEPMPLPCEGEKNIVHYALYKKPWQDDDIIDGEYFWEYAKGSPFYESILMEKQGFGETERIAKEAFKNEILDHALEIAESDRTFCKQLGKKMR